MDCELPCSAKLDGSARAHLCAKTPLMPPQPSPPPPPPPLQPLPLLPLLPLPLLPLAAPLAAPQELQQQQQQQPLQLPLQPLLLQPPLQAPMQAPPPPPPPPPPPNFASKEAATIHVCSTLARAAEAAVNGDFAERDRLIMTFFEQPLNKLYPRAPDRDEPGEPLAEPVPGIGACTEFAKCDKAMRELGSGKVNRAVRALFSGGLADLTKVTLREKLASKYPPRSADAAPLLCPPIDPHAVPLLTKEMIEETITEKPKFTAPGKDGWAVSALQDILRLASREGCHPAVRDFSVNLATVLNLIAKGELDTDEFRPLLSSRQRGVGLDKAQGVDVRPIAIASIFLEIATATLLKTESLKDAIKAKVSKFDFCLNTPGGAEAIPHTLRALLAANPSFIAIQLDLWNAFNSIDRQLILDLISDYPALGPLIRMLYAHGATAIDYSNDNFELVLLQVMGVMQGEGLSMLLFATAFGKLLRKIETQLPANTFFFRYADNCYIVGDVAPAFKVVADVTKAIEGSGMRLQPPKCEALIRPFLAYAPAELALAEANKLGFRAVPGFMACGSPVGCDAWSDLAIKKAFDTIMAKIDKLVQLASSKEAASALTVQACFCLLRFCVIPASVTFLLRSTPFALHQGHLSNVDEAVGEAVLKIIKIQRSQLADADFWKFLGRLNLDLVNGGGGIPSLKALAAPAYMGSFALTASTTRRVLGDNIDLKAYFPHAHKLVIEDGIFTKLKLEGYEMSEMYRGSVSKVQALLSQAGRKARLESALSDSSDPMRKAWLLSQASSHASAWLVAIPGLDKSLRLTNAEMTLAVRMLLGLPTTSIIASRGPGRSVRCLACSPLPLQAGAASPHHGLNPPPNPPAQQQQGHMQSVNITKDDGHHVLSCRNGGPGSVSGLMKAARHFGVNVQLERGFLGCCSQPDGRAVVSHEPPLLNYAARIGPAVGKKTRADIAITLPNGSTTLIDTSIAKPDPFKFPACSLVEGAGTAANERVKIKMAKYNEKWKLDDGNKIVIAALEAGGRWHPDLIDFTKRFFRASCGDDTKTYVYKLKATTQRVSVALRRTTSRALMEMERRAKTYPSVAVGEAHPPP